MKPLQGVTLIGLQTALGQQLNGAGSSDEKKPDAVLMPLHAYRSWILFGFGCGVRAPWILPVCSCSSPKQYSSFVVFAKPDLSGPDPMTRRECVTVILVNGSS